MWKERKENIVWRKSFELPFPSKPEPLVWSSLWSMKFSKLKSLEKPELGRIPNTE